MAIFEALPQELKYIPGLIHNTDLALPDFQRNFVWDPPAVEDPIFSVCQNYPAGSLLFLRQGNAPHFSSRGVEGAPQLGGRVPFLVLDGLKILRERLI